MISAILFPGSNAGALEPEKTYRLYLFKMAKIFAKQEVGYSDPVIFTTPGRYSMAAAVEILKRLEKNEDCEIENSSWKGYGNLVEVGIPVKLGNIKFEIMCSYEDIFIKRISGNKMKFYEFCESIRDMDFSQRA